MTDKLQIQTTAEWLGEGQLEALINTVGMDRDQAAIILRALYVAGWIIVPTREESPWEPLS